MGLSARHGRAARCMRDIAAPAAVKGARRFAEARAARGLAAERNSALAHAPRGCDQAPMRAFADSLPIDEALPRLCAALNAGPNAILVAPPGAGKTTRVPLALLDEPFAGTGKIIVLEPRRLTPPPAPTSCAPRRRSPAARRALPSA